MNAPPTWESLRARWPNASASRFVEAAGLRWHVQISGTGPVVLLLHGSGAANHTWRDITPRLVPHCTVVAPDLPGHGFTASPSSASLSLAGMRDGIRALLRELELQPSVLSGHSAGGALALALANDWPDSAVVGINAALAPPNTLMTLLTPAVQTLAGAGFIGFLTARLAESDFVFESLMKSTGSAISREQLSLYRAFATSEQHAAAVMAMFAEWNLPALAATLPTIRNAVTLILGAKDEWVPPAATIEAARALPNRTFVEITNAGHLAHEELPERVADIIISTLPQPS